MVHFTHDELSLITIYSTGSRIGLIRELRQMMEILMPDEKDLAQWASSVCNKVSVMSDAEYENLEALLIPTFEEVDYDEQSAIL